MSSLLLYLIILSEGILIGVLVISLRRKNKVEQSDKIHGSEARYKQLTDNIPASIIIRDPDFKITFCSPFTEVLTGYALPEIYSSPDFFAEITHKEDLAILDRSRLMLEAGEPFQYRYRFYHRSGLEMWAETRIMPIVNSDGDLISSLAVTFDVTATVLYQQQVEERNRDIQDFTYMLTHDLKNPLFTIRGIVKMIEEDHINSLPEDVKELLEHIAKASSRLELLVNGVIEYSKLTTQSLTPKPVSLTKVLSEVKEEFLPKYKPLNGEIIIDSDLPVVEGDEVRLYQIFTNLIGNALKYSSSNRPPQIKVFGELSKNPRQVKISVEDNGLGIPTDKLETIFRPFQRVHVEKTEGSGIGLATVKKLITKLGGDIQVSSELGKGTKFTLTFRTRNS